MNTLNKSHIQNMLDSLKVNNPELQDICLQNADGMLGKRIALASVCDSGSVYIKTDFMTYSEMNSFLRGYSFKAENRFKNPY